MSDKQTTPIKIELIRSTVNKMVPGNKLYLLTKLMREKYRKQAGWSPGLATLGGAAGGALVGSMTASEKRKRIRNALLGAVAGGGGGYAAERWMDSGRAAPVVPPKPPAVAPAVSAATTQVPRAAPVLPPATTVAPAQAIAPAPLPGEGETSWLNTAQNARSVADTASMGAMMVGGALPLPAWLLNKAKLPGGSAVSQLGGKMGGLSDAAFKTIIPIGMVLDKLSNPSSTVGWGGPLMLGAGGAMSRVPGLRAAGSLVSSTGRWFTPVSRLSGRLPLLNAALMGASALQDTVGAFRGGAAYQQAFDDGLSTPAWGRIEGKWGVPANALGSVAGLVDHTWQHPVTTITQATGITQSPQQKEQLANIWESAGYMGHDPSIKSVGLTALNVLLTPPWRTPEAIQSLIRGYQKYGKI